MLGLEKVLRLDGEFVCGRIDAILDSIAAEASGREARLCLSVSLGQGSRLSEAVRTASGNEIEIVNEAAQLRFIENDLDSQPRLVALNDSGGDELLHAIVGQHLHQVYMTCEEASPTSKTSRALNGLSALPRWEHPHLARNGSRP